MSRLTSLCRSLSILELVYGEPIDGKTVVHAIHIPPPPQGMYFWGHKVSAYPSHAKQ